MLFRCLTQEAPASSSARKRQRGASTQKRTQTKAVAAEGEPDGTSAARAPPDDATSDASCAKKQSPKDAQLRRKSEKELALAEAVVRECEVLIQSISTCAGITLATSKQIISLRNKVGNKVYVVAIGRLGPTWLSKSK